MNKKLVVVIWLTTLTTFNLNAQKSIYSLYEIVQLTRSQSPAWSRAETRRENQYWQYRTYLSDYSPQLTLQGTLPNFRSDYVPVTQEDGNIKYLRLRQNNVDLALGMTQSIGITGGTIYASSTMSRFDDFERNFTQYSGSPINLGFVQPIFQFNQLIWNKRIKPLVYEESQKNYYEELERISVISTQIYFTLLLAQIEMQIARINVANNDTIYRIAQGRYQLGKIGENELLQLELNLVNSNLAVAQAGVDLQTSTLNLKSFVGFSDIQQIRLELPDNIPEFEVDENVALKEANKNRQDPVSFERRVLEGQQELARAKGATGVNMTLFAQYGLSNRGQNFSDVYGAPVNSQLVRLELDVPIVDWGRQKSRRKTAEANLKFVEYQVAQDMLDFEQDILTQVRNFNMLREQVKAREKSDDIAQRAYSISYQLYLIGKISITDLNQSLASKDEAKQRYIQSLRDFWVAYFQLRQKTLYDFENSDLLLRELRK